MQTKIIERYFFFGILIATLFFTFFIFRPFWIVLVLGVSFSIVLYPIYKWLQTKKVPDSLSAFLTVLFFIIVLCGPLFGIGILVFNQSQEVYNIVVNTKSSVPLLELIGNKINNILPTNIPFDINQKATEFVSFLTNNITQIFSTTLSAIFSFILILLSIFYFLKDGEKWRKGLVSLSPLPDSDDKKIVVRLSQAVNGVVKGYLLIALAQGILMGIGLAIFGVPNPALWGVVASIGSMIPMLGTTIVAIPSILFLFIMGNTISAIGLLAWCFVMVGMIDNFLNPILISKKVNIPTLLILFSVLGGVSLLGPIGILIGPLTISLLYVLISIYRNGFDNHS